MLPFELAQADSLSQAISLLDSEDARPLSGGTALMLMMKAGVLRPKRLVSLRKLGLDAIEPNGTLSNVRVRNVATVGGALAHADPHMDLPPLLCALGARVTIEGRKGRRTVPV